MSTFNEKDHPRNKIGQWINKHQSVKPNVKLGASTTDEGDYIPGTYVIYEWTRDPDKVALACAWGGPDEWEDALNHGYYYEAARYGDPDWLGERGIPTLRPSYNDVRSLSNDPNVSQVLVALHNTSPHLIPDHYVTHWHERVRTLVAQQGNPRHLDYLVNDGDANVRAAVANTGSQRHVDQLLNDPDPIVREAAERTRNYNYYPGSYDERIYSADWETRARAVVDPQYMEYERLVGDRYSDVRAEVAKRVATNPASSIETQRIIAADRDPDVVKAFISACPPDNPVLENIFIGHPNKDIRDTARARSQEPIPVNNNTDAPF